MPRRLLLPCVMATMLPAPLAAADWQAGFAAVKITPEGPVAMAGCVDAYKHVLCH